MAEKNSYFYFFYMILHSELKLLWFFYQIQIISKFWWYFLEKHAFFEFFSLKTRNFGKFTYFSDNFFQNIDFFDIHRKKYTKSSIIISLIYFTVNHLQSELITQSVELINQSVK